MITIIVLLTQTIAFGILFRLRPEIVVNNTSYEKLFLSISAIFTIIIGVVTSLIAVNIGIK